ncbi:MAG: hypothetical protein LKF31_09085 [Muribaculaceae bacterium]|jgi:hypothetical protein|nr:hypothetical protein [Muribaculaceae bacterium]
MKKNLFIILAAVMAILVSACGTNEKNYRAAYDKAKAHQTKEEDIGDEFVNNVKREEHIATAIIGNDTVRLIHERVNIVDGKPQQVKLFNVIIGEFKQVFNARSYRDRLKAEGDSAYVLMSMKSRMYYVASAGFNASNEAADYVNHITDHVKILISTERPWILARQ